MSRISNHVIGLQETPAFRAGLRAYQARKHLIVPDQYRDNHDDREAWTLGWNQGFAEETVQVKL